MDKFIKFIVPEEFFPAKNVVIALGVFDGVHPGHAAVAGAACRLAAEVDALPGAVTFVPHPREVVTTAPPRLLIPVSTRIAALTAAGMKFAAQVNFSSEIAAWEPEYFLERLTSDPRFHVAGICVGSKWRFGKNGAGDRSVLEKFCRARRIAFQPVTEIEYSPGVTVSSTAIRQLIAQGKLAEAAAMCGRLPSLSGTVIHGMHIAGKELAAPTANLALEYGVLPPPGVYCGDTTVDGTVYPAILNIGTAPTYGVTEERIEIHLPGFSGSLYGKKLETFLISKLRDIRCFASPEELKAQIAKDIVQCIENFNKIRG